MAQDKLLLISLQEGQAKKIAQVISNDTCRKLLDTLADKEETETELAQKLGIPLSTVHYNLQQLMEAGLIISETFHYSVKGKEVAHYKLANKYIIIAPQSTWGIKEKLKSILPVAAFGVAVAAIIQFVQTRIPLQSAPQVLAEAVPQAVAEAAAEGAPALKATAADAAGESLAMAAQVAPQPSEPLYAMWFLIGVVITLVLYLAIDYIRSRPR
ncbi:helix-turn-helix transcriptional regulator [Candidatus Woesearchaeota archaeon]|nr:helix-turn-helix transcriptional regulator [Candidatus Woesearchaeota archaeon]